MSRSDEVVWQGVRAPFGVPSYVRMDADEREELRVLTQGWSDAARAALLASYDRLRGAGASHEEALVRALGERLP